MGSAVPEIPGSACCPERVGAGMGHGEVQSKGIKETCPAIQPSCVRAWYRR